jgi:hypothetical protein
MFTGNDERFFRRASLRVHLQGGSLHRPDLTIPRPAVNPDVVQIDGCYLCFAAPAPSVIGGARHSIGAYVF